MIISVNPLTHVITIPRAQLEFLGGSSYALNTNTFRLALKDWEDGVEGIYQLKTHNHNTTVLLGGIQYSRVLEILSPYTVTFQEVGTPYVVSLTGSNNNILEKTNLGTVQILSNNSAGLINVTEVQYGAFQNGVTIDVINGTAGFAYPIGTPLNPVNNLADAKAIATYRGFTKFFVTGSLTIGATDVISDYEFIGLGASFTSAKTTIILTAGCTTANTTYRYLKISGQQNGESNYYECIIHEMTNTHCLFAECGLIGPLGKSNSGWTVNHSADYVGCRTSSDWFVLDCNASPMTQIFTRLSGKIKLINHTHASAKTRIQLDAGEIWIDSSCTAGTMVLMGVGKCTNSSALVIDDIGLVNKDTVADATWDEATAGHVTAGTTGKALSDAGASGNPWGSPVEGNTAAGTFGELVGRKLLTIAKFLGLK